MLACTHYVAWTKLDSNIEADIVTCWLKKGLMSKNKAIKKSNDFMCGIIYKILWNYENPFSLNANGCNFKGNDLKQIKSIREDCSEICQSMYNCSHYVWNTVNGGTCWLKNGAVSKSDAIEKPYLDYFCGISLTGTTQLYFNPILCKLSYYFFSIFSRFNME